MLSTPTVASLTIDALSADGRTFVIVAEVGTTYRRHTGDGACPLALTGLFEHLMDQQGEDSLQALCMALMLVQMLLEGFREKGGGF